MNLLMVDDDDGDGPTRFLGPAARGRPLLGGVDSSSKNVSAAAQEEKNIGMMADYLQGQKVGGRKRPRQPAAATLTLGRRSAHSGHKTERDEAALRQVEIEEVRSEWRKEHIKILNGHLERDTTRELLIQSEALAALSVDRKVPMSPTQEHRVRTQALAVRWWLQMLELHHPHKTVLECAQLAREAVGYGACPDTIYRWGRMYATEGGFEADGRGDYERDLWIKQEDIELSALAWLRERKNLLHLSGESFAKFVNDELIPRHVGEGEGPERVKSLKEELSSWQLQYPVHPYTCTRWLHVLGGRFCEKTQTYMCDSHEKFKKDRDEYIKRDQGSATKPSDRELCQYQWVQMTEEAAERIYAKHNEEGVVALRKGAFSYPAPAAAEVDLNGWATISPVTPSVPAGGLAEAQPATSGGGGVGGRQMVEFHVESSDAFDEWRETQFMGGGLSVRMPFGTRPLIVSGQDEAIFNSEAATKRLAQLLLLLHTLSTEALYNTPAIMKKKC